MEKNELFKGIAMLVDDQIDDDNSEIAEIISQIEEFKMPFIKYSQLPDEDIVNHLDGISLLVLDWKLNNEIDTSDGVNLPQTLIDDMIDGNIAFLKKIKEKLFMPVFIFTNEDKDTVINILKENELYKDGIPNYIFVKNKVELIGTNNLFDEIKKWIQETPSIYVLKEWENAYKTAKNKLFLDFYQQSPSWAPILWECYKKDDDKCMNRELSEVITRNLHSRIAPISFEETIFNGFQIQNAEIHKVLEGERFIKKDYLNEDDISTGDIFYDGTKYKLNIRAQCDLARMDSPEIYYILGEVIKQSDIKKYYSDKHGQFNDQVTEMIVSCIDNGKVIKFSFKNLYIENWNDIKKTRVGRLLTPYITRIQQKYGLYFQRQGLPRIPIQAVGIISGDGNNANIIDNKK